MTVPLRSIVVIKQGKISREPQYYCQQMLFFCCRRPIQYILSLTRPHNNNSCYSSCCCHDARYWSVFIVALLSFLHTDGIFWRFPYSIIQLCLLRKDRCWLFVSNKVQFYKWSKEKHSSKHCLSPTWKQVLDLFIILSLTI